MVLETVTMSQIKLLFFLDLQFIFLFFANYTHVYTFQGGWQITNACSQL